MNDIRLNDLLLPLAEQRNTALHHGKPDIAAHYESVIRYLKITFGKRDPEIIGHATRVICD